MLILWLVKQSPTEHVEHQWLGTVCGSAPRTKPDVHLLETVSFSSCGVKKCAVFKSSAKLGGALWKYPPRPNELVITCVSSHSTSSLPFITTWTFSECEIWSQHVQVKKCNYECSPAERGGSGDCLTRYIAPQIPDEYASHGFVAAQHYEGAWTLPPSVPSCSTPPAVHVKSQSAQSAFWCFSQWVICCRDSTLPEK